ncbi:MAG: 4-alpha-glucanotransferase [Anaeroplasmataceae bacterium]|nr:4-alpha-glucanotransferase [Anaeroplasmataceae bacterium]
MMERKRQSGILLHITSLPSKYGVGTLGKEAYQFVDWLYESGMTIWQVLPLVPTNYGDSPYQSVSSTALNYYMLDFDILNSKGLLKKEEYENEFFSYIPTKVEFSLLFTKKLDILRRAFKRFSTDEPEFISFVCQKEAEDFAVFMTIKALHQYQAWPYWKKEFKNYSKDLVDWVIKNKNQEYLFWVWTQYEFLEEWKALHQYASKKNVQIMGDMPLYVAYDSVEVWKNPEMFLLSEDKKLNLVAGCPPDGFTEDGQLWGNPVYNWNYLKSTNYKWWNLRIQKAFELVDILRIDHFRGFDRFYAIPAQDTNARNGKWLDGPKIDLFKDKLDFNIVAEDLGVIDDGVRTLMKQTGYLGMKVLEFAFDGNKDNEHKPSNYKENYVVYTGTHDNMPLYAYIEELSEWAFENYKKDLQKEGELLGLNLSLKNTSMIVDSVVELAFASKARICILPMQDLLKQGARSRMNLPSTVSTDNWSYRILSSDLSEELKKRLQKYNSKYKR